MLTLIFQCQNGIFSVVQSVWHITFVTVPRQKRQQYLVSYQKTQSQATKLYLPWKTQKINIGHMPSVVIRGVRVARSLVFCIVNHRLFFCFLVFGHCTVCLSVYSFVLLSLVIVLFVLLFILLFFCLWSLYCLSFCLFCCSFVFWSLYCLSFCLFCCSFVFGHCTVCPSVYSVVFLSLVIVLFVL